MENKFKVWDKQTKQMSPEFVLFGEFTLLGAVHDWQHECGNKAKTSLEALNDLEIIQFTGFHDRKGVEIYEGWIVNGNLIVVWKNGAFMVKWPNGNTTRPNASSWKHFEVTGNIYQTP